MTVTLQSWTLLAVAIAGCSADATSGGSAGGVSTEGSGGASGSNTGGSSGNTGGSSTAGGGGETADVNQGGASPVDAGAGETATPSDAAEASTPSGDPCATFPAVPSAEPGETNTGVPAGTVLTNSGSLTISVAGQVVDSKNVAGSINVNANDVMIRNSRIQGATGTLYGIKVADGVTGTKVLHSEVSTVGGGYTGISMSNGCATNVHHWQNGLTIGGNMTVQANYVHALLDTDPAAHYDDIEVYSGNNTRIWGNQLLVNDPSGKWRGETGALNITAEFSNIDNVEANGNWFGGGSYSLYVRRSGSKPYRYTNVTIRNNRWLRGTYQFGTHSIDDPVTWSGNVFDDNGQVIGQ
jgi:hypothetical protein